MPSQHACKLHVCTITAGIPAQCSVAVGVQEYSGALCKSCLVCLSSEFLKSYIMLSVAVLAALLPVLQVCDCPLPCLIWWTATQVVHFQGAITDARG